MCSMTPRSVPRTTPRHTSGKPHDAGLYRCWALCCRNIITPHHFWQVWPLAATGIEDAFCKNCAMLCSGVRRGYEGSGVLDKETLVFLCAWGGGPAVPVPGLLRGLQLELRAVRWLPAMGWQASLGKCNGVTCVLCGSYQCARCVKW